MGKKGLFLLILVVLISSLVVASLYDDVPDTDNDGLDDDWEYHYFGNLNQGPNGDYDNDGLTNLQEYEGWVAEWFDCNNTRRRLCVYSGMFLYRHTFYNLSQACSKSQLFLEGNHATFLNCRT